MLPAIITAGSAALVAIAPQIAVPVIAAYAANVAIRTSFRAAEYAQNAGQNVILQEISDRLIDPESSINLTEAVQLKSAMPDELHLHINSGPLDGDDERWSASNE